MELLSHPFTPSMAASSGIGRAHLERWWREGRIVRLVRGVYLGADVEQTSILRARALALVVGRRQIVVDRTAAWVHGAEPLRDRPGMPVPLDLHGRRRPVGGPVPFGPDEVILLGGVRCAAALRTALDLGRQTAPERALGLIDGMLRAGSLRHQDLLDASESCAGLPGSRQLRELAAMADGRASQVAESVLRLRWYDACLPTPTPALRVAGSRMSLGLPVQRFGAILADQADGADLARWRSAGWTVLPLDRERVLTSDPGYLSEHLEREFHQHLLGQAG